MTLAERVEYMLALIDVTGPKFTPRQIVLLGLQAMEFAELSVDDVLRVKRDERDKKAGPAPEGKPE